MYEFFKRNETVNNDKTDKCLLMLWLLAAAGLNSTHLMWNGLFLEKKSVKTVRTYSLGRP